ncbi:PAMP-induced secreted peptide 2-like [Raphanus sativus]|uniref:PAMP-induced secreted peptide 2-like n=1 Tax=Raphanus sativus TaxID=3726 RepID=A0A6J0JR95_RAPSA|nr:PAMP-induced secreted peptide 2-like [Raphanus sativus]
MMNKVVLSSILFFMLVGSVLVVEARPLGLTKAEEKLVAKFFDGLSLGAIKESGPSPGGEGHKFVNRSEPLVYVKQSGPSPSGPGH